MSKIVTPREAVLAAERMMIERVVTGEDGPATEAWVKLRNRVLTEDDRKRLVREAKEAGALASR
jgi:hypothetical protein